MPPLSSELAQGVKSFTSTSGTGSVTLVAIPGFALPLARFTAGSLMSYSIQDGNNWEWGVGTVQAGNVLARTTITGTMVAGTYTQGGTALALSGSNAQVACTHHEGTDLDGVIEYYSAKSGFPATGRTTKIYYDRSTNFLWGWNGSAYVGVGGSFGSNASTVTSVAEIIQVLANIEPRTVRFAQTKVITATNGSATVTGVSTGWSTPGSAVAVGDLWKPDAGSRYYKIKFVVSDTALTLHEPYVGTTISAASTAFTFYYFQRHNIIMMPGDYTVIGTAPIVLKSGFDFTALDAYTTSLNEGQSTPNSPFSNLGDNNFTNIRWAPTNAFGAMDGMFGAAGYTAIDPTLWAGARASFNRCIVNATNQRDIHSGGTTRAPLLGGGVTEYNQCEFLQDHMFLLLPGGAVTNTAANTRLIMRGCKHEKVAGSDTASGFLLYPAVLSIGDGSAGSTPLCTADLIDPAIVYRDLDKPSAALGNATGLLVNSASIVNLHGGYVRVENSSGGIINSIGVEVTAAATVNISGSDIEASGTSGTGVLCNHASATVNIRVGNRIKGSAANSGIINTAGTVNVSANADVVGGTTGTITTAAT